MPTKDQILESKERMRKHISDPNDMISESDIQDLPIGEVDGAGKVLDIPQTDGEVLPPNAWGSIEGTAATPTEPTI